MDFEMDATQALPMDDEEFEEDQPSPNKVVAKLKVLACKGFPETVFDLREGENVIGRHESNKIVIPLKSLSKQHACIEVHGSSHLIYDMDSRNKTRRGKLFLKPNIRYELNNCDILTLADVTCQYLLPDEDDNMSDSSDSIDILQPTQAVDNAEHVENQSNVVELKTPLQKSPKNVFAEDSDDNAPTSGFKTPRDSAVIPDTQAAHRTSDTVIQESDSDTDMEDDAANNNEKAVNETDLDLSGLANASTQAVNGADLETQACNSSELDPADMATQAFQANTEDDEEEKKFDAADAATLAYEPEDARNDKKDVADEATLAYDTEEEVKDDNKQASDSALQATQAFVAPSPVAKRGDDDESMDTDDSMAEEQTQSFVAVPTQPVMNSTQNDDIGENDPAIAATQAVADQSTVAYSTDDEMAPTQAYGGDDAMAPTQACGGDDAEAPTQAFGGDDAEAPTLAYGGDDAMAATQAYGGGDDAMAPTQAYSGEDDDEMAPTQAYGGGDDAEAPTLAYGGGDDEGDDDDDAMAATQACGPDNPLAPTQKYVPDDSMAPTQAYGADDAMAATQAYPTDVADQEVTPQKQKHDGKESDEEEAEDGNDAEEPTQAYGLDDATAPTQAYGADDDNVEDDDDMAPTQAYGAEDVDISDKPTLAYDAVDGDNQDKDDADAPTLAYGKDEDDIADDAAKKSDGCKDSRKPAVDDCEEPTQAYGIEEDEAPAMDDNDEPTQAYGLDAEAETKPQMSDEDAPTQAYGDIQGEDTEDSTEEIKTKETNATANEEEDGETQIPDSEGEGDGDDVPPRTRRIESLLAQVPAKSAMTSPNREERPKKVLHVAFKEQTPESEDSEEILVPAKRSRRGRKGKPAVKEEEGKAVEKKPADDTDDVDVAPTRENSLRHKKKKTEDSEDGGSPSRKTRGKGKASKEKQPANKDVGKKASQSKVKKSKAKGASAGSRKIDEFFQQGNVESSEDNDNTSTSDPKKLNPRKATQKAEPKKSNLKRKTEEPAPRKEKEQPSKPTSTKASRKSSRRKTDDTDTDDTESLSSKPARLKGVTEVDGGSVSKVTRKSARRGSKDEESVEQKVRTSGRKGKKGLQPPLDKEKEVDSKNVDLSPVTKTVEIRVPKMDLSSESDSGVASEPQKSVGARKSSRRSIVTSSKLNEDEPSGKSETVRQKSSRKGKQNDKTSGSGDVSEKVESSATTRASRGKKGAKMNVKDSKIDKEEENSDSKVSESRVSRGRKRGAKDEIDEKEEKQESPKTTPSRTSGRRNKMEEKANTEKVPSESKRTSRKALRKADEEENDEKEQELDEKSTRRSRSKGKTSEKTVDAADSGPVRRGHRTTLDTSTTSESSPTVTRSGRQTKKTSPAKSEENFKKPGPVKKGGRGKSAVGDEDESSEEGTPIKGRNSRKGKSAEQPTPPQTPPGRRGKRSHPASQSPSSSPSTTPSPSPAKRGRHAENNTTEVHSPSLRKRVSESKPKVMFTGVTDKEWDKIVTSLGGILVESVYDCTHLITDKVRRTVKFLCCLSKGAIIINPKWLDMCKVSKTFVDPMPYLLKDRPAEKQHQFTILTSYQKASSEQVLKGKKIHVTPGVKPEPQQMKDIIKCAGGEFLSKLPSKPGASTVIVSCEQDLPSVSSAASVGVPIVSAEFILTGMLRQEANPEHFLLETGTSATKRRASTQPTHGGKRRR